MPACSDVARLTATVVAPTPPFAPTTANDLPLSGCGHRARDAIERGDQFVVIERFGDPFVDAHAHRFEQIASESMRAGDDHEAAVPGTGGAPAAISFGRRPRSRISTTKASGALGARRMRDLQPPRSTRRDPHLACAQPGHQGSSREQRREIVNTVTSPTAMLTTKAAPGCRRCLECRRGIGRDVAADLVAFIRSTKKPSTLVTWMIDAPARAPRVVGVGVEHRDRDEPRADGTGARRHAAAGDAAQPGTVQVRIPTRARVQRDQIAHALRRRVRSCCPVRFAAQCRDR